MEFHLHSLGVGIVVNFPFPRDSFAAIKKWGGSKQATDNGNEAKFNKWIRLMDITFSLPI